MAREIKTECFELCGDTVCKTIGCMRPCFTTNREGFGVEVCEHYRIELPKPDQGQPPEQKEWCDR